MAITKPPVLPAWAESGDKVTPSNAEIQVGWPLSSIPPSRQRFNWLLNFLANGIRYFSRRGLPDYDAAETYMTGDRIIGDDGKTYRSLINNNTAQTPSAQPTKWELWALTQAQSDLRVQNASAISSAAGGTADAITGAYTPAIAALSNGMTLYVRAASGNATTTPTFTPNSGTIAAKTIVKGNGLAVVAGDIAGAGHWIELQYDATMDKWVLFNPASGVGKQSVTAVRTTTVQAFPTGAWTKVAYNGKDFDPFGIFDAVTNFRLQPTVPGKYLISAAVCSTSVSASTPGTGLLVAIFKNGVMSKQVGPTRYGTNANQGIEISTVLDANGSTDYFEVYAYHDTGLANMNIAAGGETHFSAARIV